MTQECFATHFTGLHGSIASVRGGPSALVSPRSRIDDSTHLVDENLPSHRSCPGDDYWPENVSFPISRCNRTLGIHTGPRSRLYAGLPTRCQSKVRKKPGVIVA